MVKRIPLDIPDLQQIDDFKIGGVVRCTSSFDGVVPSDHHVSLAFILPQGSSGALKTVAAFAINISPRLGKVSSASDFKT